MESLIVEEEPTEWIEENKEKVNFKGQYLYMVQEAYRQLGLGGLFIVKDLPDRRSYMNVSVHTPEKLVQGVVWVDREGLQSNDYIIEKLNELLDVHERCIWELIK